MDSKNINIGSAKVSKDVTEKIHHYLIDILDPREQFTVAKFINEADKAVIKIHQENKIPVISGGTAFYFKHFLYGLSDAPASSIEIREKVESMINERSLSWAYSLLKEVDLVTYNRINENDKYRISRALEVYFDSGKPLSSFDLPSNYRNGIEPLIIGLFREKDEMERRLRLRYSIMVEKGLIQEIRDLVNSGANDEWPGMQGIGYKEFFIAMKSGELTNSQIGDLIIKNSKQYAKRQYTFFKSFSDVNWIHASKEEEIKRMINEYFFK